MTKQTKLMLAVAGAALAAASQAYASSTVNYSSGDLLLNFRDSTDGASQEGDDVTVDLGNINTFVTSVNGLSGAFAVIDSGTGYSTSSFSTAFTGANLISKVTGGTDSADTTADIIGFSAAAENLSAGGAAHGTVFLTTPILASQGATGGTPIAPAGVSPGVNTGVIIQAIGQGAEASPNGGGGTFTDTALHGGGAQADASATSYHSLIEDGGGLINYQGYQSAVVEATPSSGNVYEALWQVPESGSDTYEGYFTFKPDGEVDFNAETASAVPEPSTYGLMAGAALLCLAFRRQLRSQLA